jgi:hypothetical protein
LALVNMKRRVDGELEGVRRKGTNKMLKAKLHVRKETVECHEATIIKVSEDRLQRDFQVNLAYKLSEAEGKIVPTRLNGIYEARPLINTVY